MFETNILLYLIEKKYNKSIFEAYAYSLDRQSSKLPTDILRNRNVLSCTYIL